MKVLATMSCLLLGTSLVAQDASVRTKFQVKQVAAGVIYVDGGSDDGLSEGMRFRVFHLAPGDAIMRRREVGSIAVFAVAGNSAACEIKETIAPIQAGDTAELYQEDAQVVEMVRSSKTVRKHAQVVSFTEGDPIEEELREFVPNKLPSPEVNHIRGRVSFEQDLIVDHSSGIHTYQEGMVVRADMTRIGGTYWNFTGYWRGRLNTQTGSNSLTTLNDLLNRTYQIGLYYNNPNSKYVAGVGRFLLPWANSLNTMDGGYFGRRLKKSVTVGVFAGSTPDPTAWNYDPTRQIAGTFVSYEHGSYETVRFTSTAGAAFTRSHWKPERQFLFFENSIQMNTKVSVYHDLEVDRLAKPLVADGNNGVRLARSFLTFRYQPIKRLALDLSHNYFRDVPTFDTRLIGTGLLDNFLFQGFTGGFRLDVLRNVNLYADIGRAKRDSDTKSAVNYMGGLVLNHFLRFPFRTDLRYAKFTSSFGAGSYETIDFSRQIGDKLRFEFQGGQQHLTSTFTSQSRARYINANLDYLVGRHYILGYGWTLYRGGVQDYDQIFIDLGYRF